MENGNVERETMQILLREGRSLATVNYAKQMVQQNKQLFNIKNDGKVLYVYIRG